MVGKASHVQQRIASCAFGCLALWMPIAGEARAATPGAPSQVVAVPRDASAVVTLAPPASDGGSPILAYTVTASPGGATASASAWPILVSGLTNGTAYSFTVRAANSAGSGAASAPSNTVIPVAATVTPAVAVSESFAAALDAHGQVYAWGADTNGQLGQNRTLLQLSPTKIDGLPPIASLSFFEHALAVDVDGQVWSWGNNCGGSLGPRQTAVTSKPARVVGASGMKKALATSCSSYAVKRDGTVWQWDSLSPGLRQIAGLSDIVDMATGLGHVLALRGDGTVFAFGSNEFGELGTGTAGPRRETPLQVQGLAGVVAIAASYSGSFALLANGEIRAWGLLSGFAQPTLAITPATGLGGAAIAIAASNRGLAAVRADGTVWLWGLSLSAPSQLPGFVGARRLELGHSVNATFALDANGALTAGGLNTTAQLGQGHTNPVAGVVGVPGFASGTVQVRASVYSGAVLALKADGGVWFWGENTVGQRGDGAFIGSSVPLAVPIPATVRKIATADRFGVALDATGRVWGWGDNSQAPFDVGGVSRAVPAPIEGISSVAAIAASSIYGIVYARTDGSVWASGNLHFGGLEIARLPGLANITAVAASTDALFFLRGDGVLLAQGSNLRGELGDDTVGSRRDPAAVPGIAGAVTKVVASVYHVAALTADGRVYRWGSSFSGRRFSAASNAPVQLPGIAGAADIAVGAEALLVRLADGSMRAVGFTWLEDASGHDLALPYPIAFHEPVQAFAVGATNGFFVGRTGAVWGFGLSGWADTTRVPMLGTVGDGTYVRRLRPVVVLSNGGHGRLDTDDWYLDLQPATPEAIPSAAVPRGLATARLFGGTEALALDGTVKYRSTDLGKRVGNYVIGLVPPAFLGLVTRAPGTSAAPKLAAKAAANGGLILVQLTPAGWVDVSGQLIAYSQGVASAAGAASNILNGVNGASIPGARFCVGYGESADAMLSAQSLREILVVDGAGGTASALPCVVSGVYMGGPSTSVAGSSVTFTASVVGLAPTGTVQIRDQQSALAGPLALAPANPAVGIATLTTAGLGAGAHSIVGVYSGDAVNPAMASDLPLLHQVRGEPSVDLQGPASSELGGEVALLARVTGDNPTGSVQFRDGASDLGAPVPLAGGVATLRIAFPVVGPHVLTAAYSGDGRNGPATSPALAHAVERFLAVEVTLASSANPVEAGASLTVTVSVLGVAPTGTVTLRDGADAIGTMPLVGRSASFVLAGLPAGAHLLRADYSGDGANPSATSPTLFQEVLLPAIALTPDPRSIDFSAQSLRTTSPARRVALANGATLPVRVTQVSTAPPFAVTHDCTFVAAGATCAASVTFTPTLEGFQSGTLTVASDAGVVTITLLGTGERSLVAHYYRSILGRDPDAAGKAFWEAESQRVQQLGASVNETWFAMAQSFYTSPEYTALNRNPTLFVRDLYNTFFSRAADDSGLAFWTGNMAAGMPREVVLASFEFSQEFVGFTQAIFGNVAARAEVNTVVDFYRGLLSRLPDSGGLTFWVAKFREAQCGGGAAILAQVEAISSSFATSAEYQARARSNAQYVGDLYNSFLRRGGDLEGVTFWIGQLDGGLQTREQLRRAFMGSAEFNARVQAIVAQGCLR